MRVILQCRNMIIAWAILGGLCVIGQVDGAPPNDASAVNADVEVADLSVIPLNRIWGLDLPGTRDIDEIPIGQAVKRPGDSDDDARRRRKSYLRSLLAARRQFGRYEEGYAVYAYRDSLENAFGNATAHLNKRRQYTLDAFRAQSETYLVFFSHPSAYRVELEQVTRNGNKFKIRYRFVPQYTAATSVHFALIPVGKLPAGEYDVEITQSPLAEKFTAAGFQPVTPEQAKSLVSQSFSFRTIDPPPPDPGPDENAIEIPLTAVWSLEIPETRDARKLESEEVRKRNDSLSEELRRALSVTRKRGEAADPGFVVMGAGYEALKNAHGVLVKGEKPMDVFPTDRELTLVVYCLSSGRSMHLTQVERTGSTVEIRIEMAPRMQKYLSEHLALIPLGPLLPGKKEVRIVREPLGKVYADGGVPPMPSQEFRHVVSAPFTFAVKESRGIHLPPTR